MRPMSCATSWESEYRRTVSTSSAYTEEQRRCCLGHISYIRRQKAQRYGEYGWRQKCGAAAAGSFYYGKRRDGSAQLSGSVGRIRYAGNSRSSGLPDGFQRGTSASLSRNIGRSFSSRGSGERAALFRISSGTYAGAEAFGSYGISRWLRHR